MYRHIPLLRLCGSSVLAAVAVAVAVLRSNYVHAACNNLLVEHAASESACSTSTSLLY
jgi:hypothetical protein